MVSKFDQGIAGNNFLRLLSVVKSVQALGLNWV